MVLISSLPSATEQHEAFESNEMHELRLETWASTDTALVYSAPLFAKMDVAFEGLRMTKSDEEMEELWLIEGVAKSCWYCC